MEFRHVASCFCAIEKESSRTEKTKLLAGLFALSDVHSASIIAYLSLGDMYPAYAKKQFNIAEKLLVKAIARLVDSPVVTIQQQLDQLGDIGLVIEHVYQESEQVQFLSVLDVYQELELLIGVSGSGAQEMREQQLVAFLQKLSSVEAKYVVRIIVGVLRLGFSDMTMLDALSWMAAGDKSMRQELEDAYNICADIGKIAYTLKDGGIEAIRQMAITPGIPIRPAAAERLADAKAIVDKLGFCLAQPKLDGFRVQVHLNKRNPLNPEIRFFSRNLQDMSAMFPDLVDEIMQLDVVDCVLEGEAIAYSVETGAFLPFQETVKRKRKHDVAKTAEEFPLRLYLFDVLYLNGQSLLRLTHQERRESLLGLVPTARYQLIMPIEEYSIATAQELEHLFLTTITSGLEGLVIKRPDAQYQPGKRNFNWIKLKRQETGSLDDTLDCVILGYYFGQGKRAHFGIGALLVGVFNQDNNMFQTIAKIGTGLSDDEWKLLKKECDKLAVSDKPHEVECAKSLYPDVWTHPSLVCLVRADEITRSPMHSAGVSESNLGYALRFPRMMGMRDDKDASSVTTLSEVVTLYTLQFSRVQPDIT